MERKRPDSPVNGDWTWRTLRSVLSSYQDWIAYTEYIKSEEWRELTRIVFDRDDQTCQNCLVHESELESGNKLQCHHKHYQNLYIEAVEDLITQCHLCHEMYHDTIKAKQRIKEQ